MNCPNCSRATSPDYRFCLQCGTDLGAPTVVRSAPTSPRAPAQPVKIPFESYEDSPKESRAPWFIVGVLVLALVAALAGVGVIGYLYWESESEKATASPSPTPLNVTRAVQPTPATQETPTPKRTPSPQSVEPPIYQPQEAPPPSPSIQPTATPTPDVSRFLVFDREVHVNARSYFAQQFTVASNSRMVGSFSASTPVECFVTSANNVVIYNSGRINGGKIDVMLEPGTIYLTFNNKFSLLTGKNVRARIYLIPISP